MKNGKCTKCGSTTVHCVEKRHPEPRGLVGVTLWSQVAVDDYVCGKCGLIETYVSDLGDLDRIGKNAKRAQD